MKAYNEYQIMRPKRTRKEVVSAISAHYGLTKTTVYQWFRGTTPLGRRAGRVAKVPELLYVLGALLGDGCIYHWRGNFQVWLVGEEEFTAKFASKLSACLGRTVRHYKYGSKNAWFVRVGNAELYFLLQAVRKDYSLIEKTMQEAGQRRGWIEFVEGFFDAEGCVKIIREAARRTPKVCLDFCNTDLELLRFVQEAIRRVLGIDSRISQQLGIPPSRTSYHLRIYRKSSIAAFLTVAPTTKLTVKKRPLVEAWLKKSR